MMQEDNDEVDEEQLEQQRQLIMHIHDDAAATTTIGSSSSNDDDVDDDATLSETDDDGDNASDDGTISEDGTIDQDITTPVRTIRFCSGEDKRPIHDDDEHGPFGILSLSEQVVLPTKSYDASLSREDIKADKKDLWYSKSERLCVTSKARELAATYKAPSKLRKRSHPSRQRFLLKLEQLIDACRRSAAIQQQDDSASSCTSRRLEDDDEVRNQDPAPFVVPDLARGIESFMCPDISQMRRLHVETVLHAQDVANELEDDAATKESSIATAAHQSSQPGRLLALHIGLGDESVATALCSPSSIPVKRPRPSAASATARPRPPMLRTVSVSNASSFASASRLAQHQHHQDRSNERFSIVCASPTESDTRVVSPLMNRTKDRDLTQLSPKTLSFPPKKKRALLCHPRGRTRLALDRKRQKKQHQA